MTVWALFDGDDTLIRNSNGVLVITEPHIGLLPEDIDRGIEKPRVKHSS